jgi:YHS domain-containing protein
MLRFVVILLASLLLITVLRSILGVIMRGVADLLKGEPDKQAAAPQRRPEVPVGGELKKDPVCGTFVSTATSLKKTTGGQTVYFCSPECRDKFSG